MPISILIIALQYIAPLCIAVSVYGLYQHRNDHADPVWLKYTQMVALITSSFWIILSLGVPHFLVALTSFVILVSLLDITILAKARASLGQKPSETVDFSRSFVWIAVIIFIVRQFIIQPYHVPTGSLFPTVYPGDFLLVAQYPYGLKAPITNKTIIPIGQPKRGDIVVFEPPEAYLKQIQEDKIYVKRVVGLPGDTIQFINDVLYINGQRQEQSPDPDQHPDDNKLYRIEHLGDIDHKIVIDPNPLRSQFRNFPLYQVPENSYFLVGDNRNNSSDSRVFKAIHESQLMGKALLVWMNWDNFHINWSRIGETLIPEKHQLSS